MTEFIDRAGLAEATEFIRRKLTAFDLSKLDKLTLKASLRANPLSWRVKKPVRVAKGSRQFKSQFEVTASVIGEKYRTDDDEPIEVPVIASKEFGAPPELTIVFHTRAEMLVYAAAAGLYHFLRRTKQVPGVAANWMARRYAYGWLAEYSPNVESRPYFHDVRNLHTTCFGLDIPGALIQTESHGDQERFFDHHVSPVDYEEQTWPAKNSLIDAKRQAVAKSIHRMVGDCDASLVEEVKTAADPSTSWLVLADWLEERGDPRADWIRSHRLDLVARFGAAIQKTIDQKR